MGERCLASVVDMNPHGNGYGGDDACDSQPRESALGGDSQIVTEILGNNAFVGQVTHDHNRAVVEGVGDDGNPQTACPHQQVAKPSS